VILQRRRFLIRAAGAAAALVLGGLPAAGGSGRARAEADAAEAAIRAAAGGAEIRDGAELIALELPTYVEDGNQVPLAASVQLPEGERVAAIHLFADGNPNPEIARFRFGRPGPRARVATRIRLHRSQVVTVLAEAENGRVYATAAEVEVVMGACS